LLLLSLVTLFLGPALYLSIARGGRLARLIDRVVVVALIALVIVLLLAEMVEPLGPLALLVVAAGYLLPGALERLVRKAAQKLHIASLSLALAGLLLHALMDGAGLASSELQATSILAAAIIMHRFGVGLMLWLMVQPAFGGRAAWGMLVAMAVATVAGFEFSERLLPLAGAQVIRWLQALIIGTIIHSLIHRGHIQHNAPHPHTTG